MLHLKIYDLQQCSTNPIVFKIKKNNLHYLKKLYYCTLIAILVSLTTASNSTKTPRFHGEFCFKIVTSWGRTAVVRMAHNHQVIGSIPIPATIKKSA